MGPAQFRRTMGPLTHEEEGEFVCVLLYILLFGLLFGVIVCFGCKEMLACVGNTMWG